jgi:hypothetical protein
MLSYSTRIGTHFSSTKALKQIYSPCWCCKHAYTRRSLVLFSVEGNKTKTSKLNFPTDAENNIFHKERYNHIVLQRRYKILLYKIMV